MLDENENERFQDIQRGIEAEDPTFTGRLRDTTRRAQQRRWAGITAMVLLVLLFALMIIAESPGYAVLFAFMIIGLLMWNHRAKIAKSLRRLP